MAEPKCSGTRSGGVLGVGQCFLPPLSPCFLPDFGHKAKITSNSSGALTPESEQRQVLTGCCVYSVLWHCLYPTAVQLLPLA